MASNICICLTFPLRKKLSLGESELSPFPWPFPIAAGLYDVHEIKYIPKNYNDRNFCP